MFSVRFMHSYMCVSTLLHSQTYAGQIMVTQIPFLPLHLPLPRSVASRPITYAPIRPTCRPADGRTSAPAHASWRWPPCGVPRPPSAP